MIGTVLDSIVASALTSALLVGCVAWLGKVWANRILEHDRVKYTKELEQLRNDFETTRRMLQGELDKTIHAHRVQFETEFQILKEIWGKLAALRTAMAETRPVIDGLIPGETREERLGRRLETLKHAILDFMHAIDDHSPFYPEDIFRELEGVLKFARNELIEAEVGFEPTARSEWFREAKENMRQFGVHAAKVSDLMRRRLEALRVADYGR
jgi:hypothetical protein